MLITCSFWLLSANLSLRERGSGGEGGYTKKKVKCQLLLQYILPVVSGYICQYRVTALNKVTLWGSLKGLRPYKTNTVKCKAMSRCFCSLKNFSQSRTQSPSRLWVARRAGRPGPCGASPADSRSPRCWQTPGLRAKETPKRQRRKLALAWLTFFCGTCKRCGRCRFGCEQQQRRILMVIVVVFDRERTKKTTNVKIWKRREAAQRLEPDKSYKSHMKCNRHYEGEKQRKIFLCEDDKLWPCGHNGGFCTSVVWIEEVAKEV